jgi:hypothetical protein
MHFPFEMVEMKYFIITAYQLALYTSLDRLKKVCVWSVQMMLIYWVRTQKLLDISMEVGLEVNIECHTLMFMTYQEMQDKIMT